MIIYYQVVIDVETYLIKWSYSQLKFIIDLWFHTIFLKYKIIFALMQQQLRTITKHFIFSLSKNSYSFTLIVDMFIFSGETNGNKIRIGSLP